DPAVAAVNGSGEVTGIGSGETDISAVYQNVDGHTRITIAAAHEGCTYSVAPASQSVAVEGGAFSATVTTSGSNCEWTASANTSWITISSGSSGFATGAIAYTVAAHDDANPRTGAITIQWTGGSSQVAVEQAPITLCQYTLSSSSQDVTTAGGAFSFTATRNT